MKQMKYFCGPYVVETNNPLYVVWNKCRIGNGTFWENETLDNDDITSILAAKETLDLHKESYIEIFPLYEETYTRPSINQATFGVVSVPADKGSDLEEADFYEIDADHGYISYRVPSVELNHEKSVKLLNDITMLGMKPKFVTKGTEEEIELEKIKQVEDKGITWKFGDIELEYTKEQINLLKEYI